ncbi:serine/threonine-protein kinase [Blautia wexlerae]|uniref:serine/threonine-protein kinase n=1 Tax=Blautia wexlerae TaxID=418240 RepID=UPI0003FD1A76|nr:serine/threonine-protein kinase [Blautia wexlerae]
MLKPGDIIDDLYRIDSEIGEGGAGIIYLGYHLRLHKQIVIKKIKDDYIGMMQERSEADILKQLHHPSLPQVYDFIQRDNEIFTVMDYIQGKDLGYFIQNKIKPEEREIFLWLKQLCEVLVYLHSRKPVIIHNDIKPQNIILRPDGSVCLVDFNVSFDKENKIIYGYSKKYASPELIQSAIACQNGQERDVIQIDERSDIYSLGATMHYLIDGADCSEELLRIISKAMNPVPEQRYKSAADMLSDIQNIRTRDKDFRRLKRTQRIYYGVSALLLISGGAGIFYGWRTVTGEEFLKEYQVFAQAASGDDHAEIIKEGMELLNNKKYQLVSENFDKELSDIFYIIANCYFEEKQYQEAGNYYQKAIDLTGDNSNYYRDYAISEARLKDTKKAEEILKKAEKQGMETDGISLVRAEIALSDKEYDTAEEFFRQSIDASDDDYLKVRAYLLYARSLRESGDIEKEIQVLEEAQDNITEADKIPVVRALGSAYIRKSSLSKDDACEKKAMHCYETIDKAGESSLNDSLNLAFLYQRQKEFKEGKDILFKLKKEFPDEYRVYMRLAFLCCTEEGEKENDKRDYSDAEQYYKTAEGLYQQKINNGADDAEMKKLEDTMERLYEKGWLEK